ncbi:hypothetical protein [Streptomyces sp. WZ-12]|uniref:hypothetical protein n=1 Tax=Streptomyces sp. WZ-12 TaxID=3030210 RepID=UPI002380D9D8|nr:hypothetical protein [Streptomyces sp. WZ-12]
MGGFVESVRERVRAARAAGDPDALAMAEDELDDALRTADSVGIDPDRGAGGPSRGGAAQ